MGYGGTTFEIFSRATNALVRRQDLYYAGPAEAVVCVRDVDFQVCWVFVRGRCVWKRGVLT